MTIDLRKNLPAGLSIAGLMLPEAVAYAGIAGLRPESAILGGIAGALAYALVGRSRFAIVAPTSSSAAILAATLAAVPGGDAARAGFTTWMVLLTGALFLVATLLRLGSLTGFISRPVLKGFSFGLAVTIILHQLPELLGLEAGGSNLVSFLASIFTALPRSDGLTLSIGCSALAALLILKRFPHVPGPLLILAAGAGLGALVPLEAHGVAVVGPIHLSIGMPDLPALPWPVISELAQYALPLVLILFAESWGTVRSLALKHGNTVEANRELAAFATANLASAACGGMPVGAGFSAGTAAEAAGASGRVAGMIAALGLAALVIFGGSLVAGLPRAIPAAVVIAALSHALDIRPFLRLWRLGRDNYLALGTALGILAFGVLDGMLLAVAFSLVALLRRLSHPVIARLGQLPGSRDYVDSARHPEAVTPLDLAIFRPAAPLFYANADTILSAVSLAAREDPVVRRVILSLEESFDLDTTALDQLVEFDRQMRVQLESLAYARVHDHVRDLLKAAGETDLLARSFYSVDDAVLFLSDTSALIVPHEHKETA